MACLTLVGSRIFSTFLHLGHSLCACYSVEINELQPTNLLTLILIDTAHAGLSSQWLNTYFRYQYQAYYHLLNIAYIAIANLGR